ncbi:hypothetical protein ABIE63_002754 [Limibacillus sp. MBR-115]|jgi:hypothetical protein
MDDREIVRREAEKLALSDKNYIDLGNWNQSMQTRCRP